MTLWAGKVTVTVELEDRSSSGGMLTATRTERVRPTEDGSIADRVGDAAGAAATYVVDRVNLGAGAP